MENEYYFQQITTTLNLIYMHIILAEANAIGILDDNLYKKIVEKSYRDWMTIYGCVAEEE